MLLGLTRRRRVDAATRTPVPDERRRRSHASARSSRSRASTAPDRPREPRRHRSRARAASDDRIDGALARVGLSERADERVKSYSLGMRQRLGVARALLADPELLILDEPTNGLDPAGIHEFREMIRGFVAEGRTVLLSSHLLDEVEKICDDVAIVDRGRVVVQGSIAELAAGGQTILLATSDEEQALAMLSSTRVSPRCGSNGIRVTLDDHRGSRRRDQP